MQLFICTVLALLRFSQAAVTQSAANDYIDGILNEIFTNEKLYRNLKSATLPNFSFHTTVGTTDVRVYMENGILIGGNELERSGDCEVDDESISCTLEFADMFAKYHVKTEVSNAFGGHDGTAHMEIDFTKHESRLEVEVDKKGKHNHLRKFEIKEEVNDDMTVELTDIHGSVNKALDAKMKDKIIRKNLKAVKTALESRLSEYLESILNLTPIGSSKDKGKKSH